MVQKEPKSNSEADSEAGITTALVCISAVQLKSLRRTLVRGHAHMTSVKLSDPPCLDFHATSLTKLPYCICFWGTSLLPEQTSYVHAPLGSLMYIYESVTSYFNKPPPT